MTSMRTILLAAVAAGFALIGPASARSCDERVVGSCQSPAPAPSAAPAAEPVAEAPLPITRSTPRRSKAKTVHRRTKVRYHVARRAKPAPVRAARAPAEAPADIQELEVGEPLPARRVESPPWAAQPAPVSKSASKLAAAGEMPAAEVDTVGFGSSRDQVSEAPPAPVASPPVAAANKLVAQASPDAAQTDRRPQPAAAAPAATPVPATAPLPADTLVTAASPASDGGETSWLRTLFVALGGLLAVGSAIRMLV
jgi:hypothetical protein